MKLVQSENKNYIIMEAWCFEVNEETFANFLTRNNFAELAYHEICRPKGDIKQIAENTTDGANEEIVNKRQIREFKKAEIYPAKY